jgi:MFS family permease
MNVDSRKKAFSLIILFGLVSLFGDIIYEGARSVNGPYLKTLGVNAALVGLIAGLGEFLGYGIRFISGYFSDKTRAYWVFTFLGYGMLASVPLMALAGVWQLAALFIIMERLGKAVRSPARDTIVSQAVKQVGTGFGFALIEALDQIGAVAGPLMFAGLLLLSRVKLKTVNDYQFGYSFYWLPFCLLMICVYVAFRKVPDPSQLEGIPARPMPDKLSKVFWTYNLFTFLSTAGYVNFILMGYHFKAKGILTDSQIPFFYAIAMAVDAVAALIIGKAYDVFKVKKKNELAGLYVLIFIPAASLFIPFMAFSLNYGLIVISIILWGAVMGAHETIMRSAIADITPLKKRGTGYGIFNVSYGVAVFIGTALFGVLYDHSIFVACGCAAGFQVAAIAVFFTLKAQASEEAFHRA